MNSKSPKLVSVGIPAFNRPLGLRQTLESISNQTYREIEIIISNNGSSNPDVEKIAQEFQRKDRRISYVKQPQNLGASANFRYVFEKSSGEYFMWAADDDHWEDFFIKELVEALNNLGPGFVATNFEAQYVDRDQNKMQFFPEGEAFYAYSSNCRFERMRHILKHNYGNLVYSLFRTEPIKTSGLIFHENEIPFLLQIAFHGNFRVFPKIGLYKTTTYPIYWQAKWEQQGGNLNVFPRGLIKFPNAFIYHKKALNQIGTTIDYLNLTRGDRISLKSIAKHSIWKHLIYQMLGYKKLKTLD